MNKKIGLAIIFAMLTTLFLCAAKINKDTSDNQTLREAYKYKSYLVDSLYHVVDSLKGKK